MINNMSSMNGVNSASKTAEQNINKRLTDMESAIDDINSELSSSSLTKDTVTINNHLGVDTVDANTINTTSIEADDISGGAISSDTIVATPKIGGADGVNTLEVVTDQINDGDVTVKGNVEVQGNITLSNPTLPNATIASLHGETVTADTKVQTPLISADEAVIDTATIDNATINNIDSISSSNATFDNATISALTADTAGIDDLSADNIQADDVKADTAEIDSITADDVTANVLNLPNHIIRSNRIEMEDLQAEGNYHTIKIPVVDGLIHIHVEDKTEKDKYNEAQKWFSATIWTAQIGSSKLKSGIKHQYSNIMVAYAADDVTDSLIDIKYDVENKYIYFKTNKNGIIYYTIDTDEASVNVTYSENEYAGIGTHVYEYVPTKNQRTVLFGDNSTAYGLDIMGQLDAAVSPTYPIIDVTTLRFVNQLIYDPELAAEEDKNRKGKPHDLVAQYRTETDNIDASGWFRGNGDRQVIRTVEDEWTNDSGVTETYYRNEYEDTVTGANTGTLDTDDLLISQKAISEWNGKISHTEGGVTTESNNITKLGTVDEGEWDAGDVTTPSLTVNGTATVNGDLIINGSAYEEHTENLFVAADYINLRDGASTALSTDERSGILVENYDGNSKTLGVVTTDDGELRIGDIDVRKCYRDSTVTPAVYYTDKELTTLDANANSGNYSLFPVGSPDPTTNIQEYTYTYDDDTEPVLTRDEKSNMTNNAVLAWDNTNNKAYSTGIIYDKVNDKLTVDEADIDTINSKTINVDTALNVHNNDNDAGLIVDKVNAGDILAGTATISNADLTTTTVHGDINSASNSTIYDYNTDKLVLDVNNDETKTKSLKITDGTNTATLTADSTGLKVDKSINSANGTKIYDYSTSKVTANVNNNETQTKSLKVTDGTNTSTVTADASGLKVDGYYDAVWASAADKSAAANYVAMSDGSGHLRTVSGTVSMWIE